MKKVILSLALLIIIALAIATWYVFSNLDAIVKAAIEKYGSEATQTAVRVDKVKINLTEGSAAIHGLTVANPKGFALSHALSLGEIRVGIDLKSLKEQPYIINEIVVSAPQVFVEVNEDKKNNLNELKKNLGVGQGGAPAPKAADKGAARPEPHLILRRILFADGSIDAKVTPLKKDYKLKLPELNMRNLGGNKGATPGELAREIMDRLLDAAKAEVKKKGIDAELDKLKAKAKAKVEEEKAKLKQEADSKLEDEKQKAKDKLKGLFNK